MAAGLARSLVSKKKRRYVNEEHDLDLDLTYITPRVVAMGFPSHGKETMFRNPATEVQRWISELHSPDIVKVYNLCSERKYESASTFKHWAWFPFEDHNPCAFEVMNQFCSDVDAWLDAQDDNLVAIHCKAGKGRTGMLIATYLLHSKRHPRIDTAEKALQYYGKMRTWDGKGVTIPSQMRWVHYYEIWLRNSNALGEQTSAVDAAAAATALTRPPSSGLLPAYRPKTLAIRHVRLVTVPQFDPMVWGGGCDPYMIVRVQAHGSGSSTRIPDPLDTPSCERWRATPVYNQQEQQGSRVQKCPPNMKYIDLDICGDTFTGSTHAGALCVRGNVQIVLKDMDEHGSDEKMCSLWFNTAFVDGHFLVFDKRVVDSACKDKSNRLFNRHFKIEIYVEQVPDSWFDQRRVKPLGEPVEEEPDRFSVDGNTDEESDAPQDAASPPAAGRAEGGAEDAKESGPPKPPRPPLDRDVQSSKVPGRSSRMLEKHISQRQGVFDTL